VNRWNGAKSVPIREHWIAVDSAIHGSPDLLIHRRKGKDLNIIDDTRYRLHALRHRLSVGLEYWTSDLTKKRYRDSVDPKGQIIKNALYGSVTS
jgi:hypothetical protein